MEPLPYVAPETAAVGAPAPVDGYYVPAAVMNGVGFLLFLAMVAAIMVMCCNRDGHLE